MKKHISLYLGACLLGSLYSCSAPQQAHTLAYQIDNDSTLAIVDSMARVVIANGLNAGSGYSQIWARDMNTFIETACEVTDHKDLRNAILLFFALQQPNGEMIDGYVKKEDFTWNDNVPYYSDAAPEHVGFKNTVETDQETSLIQIVGKYVRKTGDRSILSEVVAGQTVSERMERMVEYLLKERFDPQRGLLYGAMTADWGDVQPNDDFGVDMNEHSHKAIDIYDNAMFIIALDDLQQLTDDQTQKARWKKLRQQIADNARKHLWDSKNHKFYPHLYLTTSPIPATFDENTIYYHGGTTIAMEAGLLSKEEIKEANDRMLENVRLSNMPSIGLTLYPPYPDNLFRGGMSKAYVYQNGGDWTWFGGRTIQQLIKHGFVEEAYDEIRPMIDRVIQNKGFYEWYGQGNVPSGSGHFKGSAGVLAKAIDMLKRWAEAELENGKKDK